MNNLAFLRSQEFPLSEECFNKNSLAIDFDLGLLFFSANHKLYSMNLNSHEITLLHDLFKEVGNHIGSEIVCSKFLIEDKLYFLLFKNGKIVTYDSYNKELFEHQIDVSAPIDDAKFSHDQELLAVSTHNCQMLLFNKIMILQTSCDMSKGDYGTNELVNVNWGSKSTQFHGEGMRDKRTVKEEHFSVPKWDDRKCCIDWRGDDSYFVVNFVCSNGFRLLKLFDRKGILQHTSEYVAGLERCIAWKPSGTLIAASQSLPNKRSIIFFEKNGLQHGEFDLPATSNAFVIDRLAWSNDSEILLIYGYEIAKSENEESSKVNPSIFLYTQSNYHWYLKLKLQFENLTIAKIPLIEDILWDEHDNYTLHVITSPATYNIRSFSKQLNACDGKLLVVDGNRLHVSDFERTLVPPPFSNYTIVFKDQIAQLYQTPDNLVVHLNYDQLVLFETKSYTFNECANLNYPIKYEFENVPSDFTTLYIPIFFEKVHQICHMSLPVIVNDRRIFGLIGHKIAFFDRNHSDQHQLCVLTDIGESISTLTTLSNKQILLAGISGQIYCYDIENSRCEEYSPTGGTSKILYDSIPTCLLVYVDEQTEKPHVIVQTSRNSLYFDHCLIMSSMVTSVSLHLNKYLLFSTSDSFFYCWPLQNFDLLRLNKTHPPRIIEKGAKIIATSNSQAKVVLQMPRGNLEAFYPLTLVLEQAEKSLDKLDFLTAFQMLRRNRINLNYICDYNFDLFTKNCELFLQQIGMDRLDWICLFLSELSNGNTYSLLHNHSEVRNTGKVDTICELLREAMIKIDQIKYINPILLTYIKREKPRIERALQIAKNLPNNKLRDDAIKFLLYVVNVNRLFDEALGTYDFDTVLMVAAKSNKDPKEYLSLINAFKAIEDENYRFYKIDVHLQRYERALTHLSLCENRDDEALQLIEQKRLFKEAIEIYTQNDSSQRNSKHVTQIWDLYAEYLFKKMYYREAAIAFKKAGNYAQAFKMHLMCSNWNLATVCARKMCSANDDTNATICNEEFSKLIQSVAQQIALNGNHVDSAYIQEHYLRDPTEAFRTLVKGHRWDHAIRCFYDHRLPQYLFDDELLIELQAAVESMMEVIDSNLSKLNDHFNRLGELEESRMRHSHGLANNIDADVDAYSDTSSIFDSSSSVKSSESNLSRNSLKTNRSNSRIKHQKRQEQRKYILKKGSANEDIQIVHAVKELIGHCNNIFNDSDTMVVTLYDLDRVQESGALQGKLQLLLSLATRIVTYIWSSEYFERRLVEDEALKTAPKISESNKWKIVLN